MSTPSLRAPVQPPAGAPRDVRGEARTGEREGEADTDEPAPQVGDLAAAQLDHVAQAELPAPGVTEPAAEVAKPAAETTEAPPAEPTEKRRLSRLPRVAVSGLFLIATIAALFVARDLILPVLIAALLSLLLSPAVAALERVRLPRALAVLVVMICALAVLGGLAAHLYSPAQEWLHAGPARYKELQRKLRIIKQPVEAVRGATEQIAAAAEPSPGAKKPREVVVERKSFSSFITNTQVVVVGAFSTVILLFFLLLSGDIFLRKLIRVIPNLRDKIRAVEISRTIEHQIGRYFVAVFTINVCLGVVTGLAMWAWKMPTAALLGTIVAIFNFVPYLGPAASLALLALVSALTFDTVPHMLGPPLTFMAFTLVEGQIVQPIVFGRQLSTTPVVMFVWVLFWGWLWGIPGVAVAVPLLVVVKICAEHIPSWAPIAEFLGRE